MRELKRTKIEGRIYLFPIPVVAERKYLIFCSSEEEAEEIALLVRTKKVSHPDLISEDFMFLTLHTDKATKIFVLSPKIALESEA
jgi:hypothetical protein